MVVRRFRLRWRDRTTFSRVTRPKQTNNPLIDHPSDPWVRPLVLICLVQPMVQPPQTGGPMVGPWSDLWSKPSSAKKTQKLSQKCCWTHGSTTCPGVCALWTMVWTMCDATRQPFVTIHGSDWVLDHVSSTPSNPWSQPKLFWKYNFLVRGSKRKISCFVGKIGTPKGN